MGVRGQGEAVTRIIVAAAGVLVDVGGLDEGTGLGIEPVTGEGAGIVVTSKHLAFEAAVAAFALARPEGVGVATERLDLAGVGKGQLEPGAERDLLARGEVDRDQGAARGAAESTIFEKEPQFRIKLAEAGRGLRVRGSAVAGVARPETITLPSEGVKWHGDVGGVALTIKD